MSLIVAKFGGTSVGNGERIKKAAQSVANEYFKGNQKFDPQNGLNTRTAKVSKQGHTLMIQMPIYIVLHCLKD